MRPQPAEEHPHGLSDDAFDALFTTRSSFKETVMQALKRILFTCARLAVVGSVYAESAVEVFLNPS